MLFKINSANFWKTCHICHLSESEPVENILDILENGASILKKETCPINIAKNNVW